MLKEEESRPSFHDVGGCLPGTTDRNLERKPESHNSRTEEKVLLVQVLQRGDTESDSERDLAELRGLVGTSGGVIVSNIYQRIDRANSATLIGKGKVEELAELCRHTGADTVLFGGNLSPVWQRNLEKAVGIKVIDRTELILDIFAQHARTNDGKIQVELAQLKYLLPRLTGKGVMLSRLGGGIGTRGPGETKLESDRRRIKARIDRFNREVEHLSQIRATERKNRIRQKRTVVSIVGYTNSGKSSLLNALTGADVLVEDQLFATLDPTTRRFELPNGEEILLSDTVGFIHNLPEGLINAFRATLEEVTYSNMLIHLVDVSGPYVETEISSVYEVLRDLDAHTKPTLFVFNKIDKVEKPAIVEGFLRRYPGSTAVSVTQKIGLEALGEALVRESRAGKTHVVLRIPVSDGRTIAELRGSSEIIEETLDGEFLSIQAVVPSALLYRFESYSQG